MAMPTAAHAARKQWGRLLQTLGLLSRIGRRLRLLAPAQNQPKVSRCPRHLLLLHPARRVAGPRKVRLRQVRDREQANLASKVLVKSRQERLARAVTDSPMGCGQGYARQPKAWSLFGANQGLGWESMEILPTACLSLGCSGKPSAGY